MAARRSTDAPPATPPEPAEAAASTPAASEQPAPADAGDAWTGGPPGMPGPSVLVVRARRDSRRRAGRSFGTQETIVPLDALTAQQIAAIEGDPELVVTRSV